LSVPEILDKLTLYPPGLVEITGGEPLEQPEEVTLLCGELLKSGATVLIETNGSRDISRLPGGVIRIMDIKCPGSGMHRRNLFSNFNYLRPQDQIKFVVADRNDFDWSVRLIKEHNLIRKAVILFSAVTGRVGPEELAEWILATGLMLRMQVQLHKYIWPHPDKEV
jgi:7-carboxy-7-deazaguanine synthase